MKETFSCVHHFQTIHAVAFKLIGLPDYTQKIVFFLQENVVASRINDALKILHLNGPPLGSELLKEVVFYMFERTLIMLIDILGFQHQNQSYSLMKVVDNTVVSELEIDVQFGLGML